MSRRNGDRSRFNRRRKANLQSRERTRALRKVLDQPKETRTKAE